MPSELQSLDTIFNSRIFRIPDYQRGYSWQRRPQLGDFWDDLTRLREASSHYTGQLTVEKVPDSAWQKWDEDTPLIQVKGYKPFYVVDGQQRLTTAIILIKSLLDRVSAGEQLALSDKEDLTKKYLVQQAGVSRAYLFGYERDNPSYEYLKTQILGEPSNQYQGTETTYTANLRAAQLFFSKKLEGSTHDDVERWFKALTQKFLFNVYELEQELDVFVVFETMNNRGKPLSRLELLKNRLIYLSTLLPAPIEEQNRATLRRNINESWKTVFEYLGRELGNSLDDDEFLRAHWIMYFEYKRDEAAQFASFLLGQHFTTARIESGQLGDAELQRYVTSVQDSVRMWHAIHFPGQAKDLEADVRCALERFIRLSWGAFEPLAMAATQKASNSADLVAFLSAAERFVFTIGRLSRRRADTGDSEFYRLAGQLFRGGKTLREVTQDVNNRADDHFSFEKATAEIKDLFDSGEGFYSWEGLKYFLFEYEQHLKEKAGMSAVKMTWAEFVSVKKDQVTVEHIYPVSPGPGQWAAFAAYSVKEQRILRNALGNLLALSQSRNSRLSNRRFADKVADNDEVRGYFNGSYSEIEVSKASDWTPERILERSLVMLEFLERRWKVSLGTRSDKLRFLNLEFLEQRSRDESGIATSLSGKAVAVTAGERS